MSRRLTRAVDLDFMGEHRITDALPALATIPGKRSTTARRRCPSSIPRTISGTAGSAIASTPGRSFARSRRLRGERWPGGRGARADQSPSRQPDAASLQEEQEDGGGERPLEELLDLAGG